MRRIALASTTLLALCTGTQAADQVKLGNLTQLSGPISPAGTETKRGIDLALEELGNKLGGLPVKYTVVDDKTNPAEAVQGASKLIDDAKVDFVTGLGASNTLIPVFKSFVDAGIFAVGALAGPLQFAGKECHPNGFFVSFSNDDWPAAVGKYMTDKGVKSAFFLGADYQAGYEHVGAAIRYFNAKRSGTIMAIRGLSDIPKMRGFELLVAGTEGGELLRPGFRVPRIQSSLDRYGYAIFSGDDASQAAARAEHAARVEFEFSA